MKKVRRNEPRTTPSSAVKTWIEFELIDERMANRCGTAADVILTDGTHRTGGSISLERCDLTISILASASFSFLKSTAVNGGLREFYAGEEESMTSTSNAGDVGGFPVDVALSVFGQQSSRRPQDWNDAWKAAEQGKGCETIPYSIYRDACIRNSPSVGQFCKQDAWSCDGLETRRFARTSTISPRSLRGSRAGEGC